MNPSWPFFARSMELESELDVNCENPPCLDMILGGGFTFFHVYPTAEMVQFHKYFSDGLNPGVVSNMFRQSDLIRSTVQH